jgi:elongator complex protein 3 (tRNA carboxymethyluridine synthase)
LLLIPKYHSVSTFLFQIINYHLRITVMKPTIKKFIKKVLAENPQNLQSLEVVKKSFCSEEKTNFSKNAEIKKVYDEMIKNKEIKPNETLEKLLVTKKIRTLSGVAIVAVLTKPYPCPGKCIYCPDESAMPKSYLSNEPAVMRAILTKFHPYKQTQTRLRALQLNGHITDKIELIVMGGTFSYFPPRYQNWFIKECFRAANDFSRNKMKNKNKSGLEKEKTRNEKATNRIVGLTLETRPDYINQKEVIKFRKLGATRVEIGVQNISDKILQLNKRGHLIKQTAEATQLLKDAGFKINYHLMPGMPGSTPQKDFRMFQTIFSDQRFQPDMIKIYPCVVTKNSEIYRLWKNKKYTPLNNDQTKKLLKKIKSILPGYVRVNRLIRDIPEASIIAGPNISNLRQILQQEGAKCQCIRCREVREDYSLKDKIVLNRIDYPASDGKEIFLQYISPDRKKLYALLRLRILNKKTSQNHFIKALKNAALIREIHTYGKLAKINKSSQQSPQHIGLGKKLMREAEKIARDEFGFNKIAVISGVGVRGYYKKLGYGLKDEYMIKSI